MNAYHNHYRNNEILTASPAQLLIMFYDAAIKFVKRAEMALEDRNMEAKGVAINRAIAILAELSATLDHEVGGEISANLERLYDYMIRELSQFNLKNDPSKLPPVVNMLSGLRETWVQAIEEVQKAAGGKPEETNSAVNVGLGRGYGRSF